MRFAFALGVLFFLAAGSAQAGSSYGCRPLPNMKNFEPRGTGPASLLRMHCLAVPPTSFTGTPPMVSPDGRRAFVHQARHGLHVFDLSTGALTASLPYDPTFLQLEALRGPTVFEWAADSRSIWGADQQFVSPSHFVKSPLQPIRIWTARRVVRFPVSGRSIHDLDGLRWLDGRGRAIALFDARGGYYRPERPVKKPVLAFVDASKGRVEQHMPITDMPGYPGGPIDLAYVSIRTIASIKRADGRFTIVMQWSRKGWTEWTQGARPRNLPLRYDGQAVRATLTRAGTGILVSNPLSASGKICETWSRQKCPPPTPVTGLVAALQSLPSGKQIWAIRDTATKMGGTYPAPAISPDGRLAMIGIPANDEYRLALISMKDGRVLQKIRPPWASEVVVSFSPDGSLAYVSGGATIAVYAIRRN